MLTIGQYLAPSNSHLPVRRYVHPDTFKHFEQEAHAMGFSHARRRHGAFELPRRPASARCRGKPRLLGQPSRDKTASSYYFNSKQLALI